ncbi:MAG: MerR family transcriptional regulator [Lachnospiraceae bacterium]|nr:MerR family transcriptional regulator [Lachnospiraceae bacterium]
MEKKMTSGEIAKKAGVSQKAVRLYDEKGLLKPADYSEGNYRLYDKESLVILEKIVALKTIGFSLEEIRDNLVAGDAVDIEDALRIQLKEMEDRKYQTQKVIDAISRTLDRKEGKLDWDDVADMVRNISLDQKADEHHWDALRHTSQEKDWYELIFESLEIGSRERILDLGCGFAKLWRNNWARIPEGSTILGYDIHGSWADNFEGYLKENKDSLPKGASVTLEFEDLEGDKAWKKIDREKKFSLVIAHYINFELKDPAKFVERASNVVAKGGRFSFNGAAVNRWRKYFRDVLEEIGAVTSGIDAILDEEMKDQDKCQKMLEKYFDRVEKTEISNNWHYDNVDDIIAKMKTSFEGNEKIISDNEKKIRAYFEKKIKAEGEVVITVESLFWHCYK